MKTDKVSKCLVQCEFRRDGSGICPRQRIVQNRFRLLQPLVMAFFRRKNGPFFLNFKQEAAIGQPLYRRAVFGLSFQQRHHSPVELFPGMGPTANHSNLIWRTVVSRVAVRMQVPLETSQKCLWVAGATPRLVIFSILWRCFSIFFFNP